MTKLLTAAIRSEQIKEYKSVGEAWKASSQNPEDIATKFSVSGDCIRYWCHRHQEAIKLLTATGNHSDLNSPLNAIESITTTSKCSCYTYDIWHLLMGSTSTKEALTIIQDQGSTVRQQLRTKSVMLRVILVLYFIIKVLLTTYQITESTNTLLLPTTIVNYRGRQNCRKCKKVKMSCSHQGGWRKRPNWSSVQRKLAIPYLSLFLPPRLVARNHHWLLATGF